MSFVRRHPDTYASASGNKCLTAGTYQMTSIGVPSLDDILGGGLPLGMMLLILGTDLHTSYPNLVHRYFIAQGLASGHHISVVDDNAKELVSNCMWMQTSEPVTEKDNEDESFLNPTKLVPISKVKIAWRYENMKQFQTSVSHQSPMQSSCPFELIRRIPNQVIQEAVSSERLHYMCTNESVFESLETNLMNSPNAIHRLSIPLLGSPDWGDLLPSDLLRFLHRLRALLRRNRTSLCACVTLSVRLSTENYGGTGWLKKLAMLSDGCIRLQSFAADPSLSAMFPGLHGLVHIENLPVPCSLVTPSDKFSELRGLSNYSSIDTGGSENNLAFKCTRKNFLIETLHLDVEGGLSERRTTVPTSAGGTTLGPKLLNDTSLASVPIIREEPSEAPSGTVSGEKKKKKRVNFQTDRPDMFDF